MYGCPVLKAPVIWVAQYFRCSIPALQGDCHMFMLEDPRPRVLALGTYRMSLRDALLVLSSPEAKVP